MIPARVLVVEDERIIAMTIRQMLEERGYTVTGTAATAKTAVQQARTTSPDIVLMDIRLSGDVDGIEAARQIEADSGTPIVFLTSYTEDETIRRASQCRAYSYLVKPVQAAELHATLQIAISRHGFDKQLCQSEHRLRLAMRASALAVWDWDRRTDSVETTGDTGEVLGHASATIRTIDSMLSGVADEDRCEVDAFLGEPEDGPAARNLTFRYLGDDRAVRWIQMFAAADPSPERRHHTVGTLRNVTVSMENERQLQQAAALFENIADAIVIASPALRVTTLNPAFERMTGYTKEDCIGRDVREIFEAGFPASLPTTMRWQGETQCPRRDGVPLSISLTVIPVMDESTVSAVVFTFSDITPLRRMEAELDFLTHHDALTGLPNRLLFHQRMDEWTATPHPFFIFYIDLDKFQLVNESKGHTRGDLVLRTTSDRLRGLLQESDFAARLGGDEFVILSQRMAGDDDVVRFGRLVREVIAEPVMTDLGGIITTASVGVSRYPSDGQRREALLLAADAAMYDAKREGPNSCRRYTGVLARPRTERYELEQEIRRAFASSQLVLLYQPTVSLRDGGVAGVEALVRWQHPERGVLNPDRFVPVAEDAGLIEQLGEAVLRMACRDWQYWADAGIPAPRLSINISARQLTRGGFSGVLRNILGEFPVPAAGMEIEITESSPQTLENGRPFIREVKEMGIALSIDDFGTGYSSLASLRELPVDRVKLDRSFLPKGTPGAADFALLQAIVGIAHAMGLQITAEGIETERQLELVRRAQCDEAQGFLFGYPMSFAETVRFVKERNSTTTTSS
ncbi:MAG TPA: EAL domain-containing protein [Bryobacteraceae bacterium]|nr:EAL domain-containing protein [Bryobacteraceae bacterium]